MPVETDPTLQLAGVVTITPPAAFPVDAAAARAHLRIDETSQGSSPLDLYIAAAVDFAEDSMECSLMPRELMATFYGGERVILPRGPVLDIVSVSNAVETATTAYTTRNVGNTIEILPTVSLLYPVTVVYHAGYESAAVVPAAIKAAILAHVGTLYENRESIADKSMAVVPHSLADFYRLKSRARGMA